ncbi:MAG: hypothetical protein U0894_10205 [Pirellulales bacterium]
MGKPAVIERHAKIGGGCTHWGTIPGKALRLFDFSNDGSEQQQAVSGCWS